MKVSGYIPVRNGNSLDYTWREAARSLIPIVSELILVDSDSEPAERMAMEEFAAADSRIRIVNWPWPNPVGDRDFFVRWLNFGRHQCKYPMQITLDADEVLHESAYEEILRSAKNGECRRMRRLNFWGSLDRLAPRGTVCGDVVVRLGPTHLDMVSDGWHTPEPEIRVRADAHSIIEDSIFHYGFIRRPDAFLAKSRVMQPALIGSYDERLKRAEEQPAKWMEYAPFTKPLQEWSGTHPAVAHDWLRNRGFSP